MSRKIVKLSAVFAAMSSTVVTLPASAVDVGMGAGIVGGSGASVYVPVRFGNWRIEPELSYRRYTLDETNLTIPSSSNNYESNNYAIGTGVYWRQPIGSSLESYIGGRIGYTWYDAKRTYPNNPGSNWKQEASGYYIGPALGAEYFFTKQFSVGLDVSLIYQSQSTDINAASVGHTDTTTLSTETRTTLRYYFGQ